MTDDAVELVGSPTTDDLALAHLDLVRRVVRDASRALPVHVDAGDLHSAGVTALVLAARGYDPQHGVPFPRYAAIRIRGAVLDELRKSDVAPRSVRRRSRELEAARTELATALGRVPALAEVARHLGTSLAEVEKTLDDVARARVVPLHDDGVHDHERSLVSRALTPEDHAVRSEQLAYLRDAIAELPPRQRTVVEEYFIAERPMAEIARLLDVSESRISQIRAEALVLLREVLGRALDTDHVATIERPDGISARRRQAYYAAVMARHGVSGHPGRS